MSLEKDISINLEQLDVEWALLPSLFHDYADEASILSLEIKKNKLLVSKKRGELDKAVRLDPQTYFGKASVTENQIASYLDQDEEIYNLRLAGLELERRNSLCEDTGKTIELKRDALKHITGLLNSEYWATMQTNLKDRAALAMAAYNSKQDVRRKIKLRLRHETENQ